jgi:fatty acid desaturase
VVLALPLLVVYSHYRLRHLQHHRFLRTAQDTEFFGFDARTPLTVGALLRGLFDYRRLGVVVRDVVRAARGRWRYDFGEVSPAVRRHIVADHLVLGAVLLVAVGVCAAGFGEVVARLWLLPLVLAVPVHFLVELPEHVLCDSDSTDVLANTRSITGSRLSTWFTNGNNLHVEHHAAMVVPMNRLRTRHDEARRRARYVEDSYPAFYRTLGWALVRGESKRVRADAGCGCATPPTESRREHRCP